MKRSLLSILLVAFFLVSCAQNNCNVKRGYAFYTMSLPGMIMKDDNGNDVPPVINIERFIYIECVGTNMPVIQSVLYNNSEYKPAITRVTEKTVSVGRMQASGEGMGVYKLTARKGYTLWKIDLQPANDNTNVKQDCKNIIIKTTDKGKICKFYIYKEILLASLPRY